MAAADPDPVAHRFPENYSKLGGSLNPMTRGDYVSQTWVAKMALIGWLVIVVVSVQSTVNAHPSYLSPHAG